MTMPISRLFVLVMEWAGRHGADDLRNKPGLWVHDTVDAAGLEAITVKINAHDETIDSVPPIHAALLREKYFPGIIAMINPVGGEMIASGLPNENEDGLIRHFEEQP